MGWPGELVGLICRVTLGCIGWLRGGRGVRRAVSGERVEVWDTKNTLYRAQDWSRARQTIICVDSNSDRGSKTRWQGDKTSAMEAEMEAECKLIMESLEREDGSKNAKGKGLAGRVWTSCVSCGRSAVLESIGWVGKKQEQAASEKNRFVLTVCGRCERKGVGGVGEAAATRCSYTGRS